MALNEMVQVDRALSDERRRESQDAKNSREEEALQSMKEEYDRSANAISSQSKYKTASGSQTQGVARVNQEGGLIDIVTRIDSNERQMKKPSQTVATLSEK